MTGGSDSLLHSYCMHRVQSYDDDAGDGRSPGLRLVTSLP